MPFPIRSRYPFTEAGIASLGSSPLSGVYGIFSNRVCIYVGAAEDIRAHLQERFAGRRFQDYEPTYFLVGLNPSKGLTNAQAELIREYKPVAQYR